MSLATDYPTYGIKSQASMVRVLAGCVVGCSAGVLVIQPIIGKGGLDLFGCTDLLAVVVAVASIFMAYFDRKTARDLNEMTRGDGLDQALPPVIVTANIMDKGVNKIQTRRLLNTGITSTEARAIFAKTQPQLTYLILAVLIYIATYTLLVATIGTLVATFLGTRSQINTGNAATVADTYIQVGIVAVIAWPIAYICRRLLDAKGKKEQAAYIASNSDKLTVIEEWTWKDERFAQIAETLRLKTKTLKVTSPDLEESLFEALKALAAYAEIPAPNPEMKAIAEATHLHSDPAAKAVADEYAHQSYPKDVAAMIAESRKDGFMEAVDEFSKVLEDRSLLAVAHNMQPSK